jgi:hypothetical protein
VWVIRATACEEHAVAPLNLVRPLMREHLSNVAHAAQAHEQGGRRVC